MRLPTGICAVVLAIVLVAMPRAQSPRAGIDVAGLIVPSRRRTICIAMSMAAGCRASRCLAIASPTALSPRSPTAPTSTCARSSKRSPRVRTGRADRPPSRSPICYASVMDEARLEQLGPAPIEPELRKIDSDPNAARPGGRGGVPVVDRRRRAVRRLRRHRPAEPRTTGRAGAPGRDASARSRLLPRGQSGIGSDSRPHTSHVSRTHLHAQRTAGRRTTTGPCSPWRPSSRRSNGPKPRTATSARPTHGSRCGSWPPRCRASTGRRGRSRKVSTDRPAVILAQPSFFKAFAAMVPRCRSPRGGRGSSPLRHRGRPVPEPALRQRPLRLLRRRC